MGGATRGRGSGHTISSSSSSFSSFSGSFWPSPPPPPVLWGPWKRVLGSPGKGAAMEGQGWDGVYWFITHSPLGVDRVFVDNHVDGSGLGVGGYCTL